MNDTAFWMGISQNIHFHLFVAALSLTICLHDQEWNPIASCSAVPATLRYFCSGFFFGPEDSLDENLDLSGYF